MWLFMPMHHFCFCFAFLAWPVFLEDLTILLVLFFLYSDSIPGLLILAVESLLLVAGLME